MADTLLKESSESVISGHVGGATITQPVIEPDAKELRSKVRAISSIDQIYLICEAAFSPDSERNIKNGRIAERYNDGAPFPEGYLKQKGQKFRHNFSTGFMSGILESAIGSPVDVIDQAQYLTSASLSEEDDPDGTKTEAYRRKFTKLLRSWEGWRTHIYNIAQEDVVFGYGAVFCDDPDDWRPQEYRQDEFGVPDNCFTEGHEILTKTGWKNFKDVEPGEEVATVNITTGQLMFQPIIKIVAYPYSGEVLEFRNVTVTPNHRMLVYGTSHRYGRDLLDLQPRFVRADKVKRQYRMSSFVDAKRHASRFVSPFPDKISGEDWCEFMGWYIAEGSCRGTKTSNVIFTGRKGTRRQVRISQNPGNKKDHIRKLLNRTKWIWREYSHEFATCDAELHKYLFKLGNSHERFIPREMFDYPTEWLLQFVNALMLADGSSDKRTGAVSKTYATSSPKLADNVQELLIRLGFRSHILTTQPRRCFGKYIQRTLYRITCAKPRMTCVMSITPHQYQGIVRCVTVPNETIIVRDGAKKRPLITGNTGQYASKAQFVPRKKSFLIHELIDNLKDRKAAEAAGWNVENCIEALNEAMPQDRAGGTGGGQAATSRTFIDLIRDGNAGSSYDPRARTVDVYILLATESDGRVSKFIVTQTHRRLLYESYDEFEKMSDVVVFYSLNPGSGTLYSSKGGGRKLINLATSAERGRNKAADNTYLAGLVWMQSEKGMVAVQMKVFDQYAIIGSEATIVEKGFPDMSDTYDRNDERLTRYAEQSFGAYIPQKPAEPQTGGRDKTAREVSIEYQRDQISRAAWLKRFFGQFGDEMTIIAKKAGSPDTRDKEAKEWQEDMREHDGITPDLLKKLVNQPQGQLVQDMTAQRTQALSTLAPLILASPFFDKFKTERELSIRAIGKELTDQLMFKNGIDPTDEAAQINKQILENSAIRSGESPNVIPSDNHKVHSKWIISDLQHSEPGIAAKVKDGSIDPQILDNVQTAIKHGDAHVAMGEAQAKQMNNQDDAKEFEQHKAFYADAQQKLDAALKQLLELRQKQAQQPQGGQAQAPDGLMPPSVPSSQPSDGAERTYGGMSEKVLVSWIAHAEELPVEIRQQLEQLSGLTPEKASSNGATPSAPQENTNRPLTMSSPGLTT